MSQTCEHCEKQPATVVKTSKYTSETLHVCQQCSEKINKARAEMEQIVPQLAFLLREKEDKR